MTGLTPIKAIRAKCIDCSAGSKKEVRECPAKDCPLHMYRMGKNPNRKGKKMSAEQKKAATVRLEAARQKKMELS